MSEVVKCPSKIKCPFKRFNLINGMECTLTESIPEHVVAWCSKPWEINVLKKVE